MMLCLMPLLPDILKGVECSVPSDIKSSVERVEDFANLRTQIFVLQKSFNDQAKLEENKAQNRNDESIKNEMNRLIQQQIALRKGKAPSLVSHPLLQLFVKQLDQQQASSRVLCFREMEKSLAQLSERTIGPFRAKIDQLSSQYAELSQSKGKGSELERVKNQLQQSKEQYNTTVVSTEHLWRELSHLFAALNHSINVLIISIILKLQYKLTYFIL